MHNKHAPSRICFYYKKVRKMRHDQSIVANSFASSNSAQVCSQKFCSYNFMLNEAPKNNDVMRIENIVLNKVPYSNDATCIESNVHLTAMGAQSFSIWSLCSHHAEKLTYQTREIMTQYQERFVRIEKNLSLGKNGGYIPSSVGGRSIRVGRLAGRQAVRQKFL